MMKDYRLVKLRQILDCQDPSCINVYVTTKQYGCKDSIHPF